MVMWEALEIGMNNVLTSGEAAAIIFVPTFVFVIICFRCKSSTQLTWALILSIIYCLIMVALTVSIAIGAGKCPVNLTLMFLAMIATLHIIAWDVAVIPMFSVFSYGHF